MASKTNLVTQSAEDLEDQTTPSKSCSQMNIREVITVEPLIASYVMASILCAPALATLEFEKACRSDLGLNDTVCEAIVGADHTNYSDATIEIQTLIANMHSWQQPLQTVVPLMLVMFLGSYSDRHKVRKPFMLLPIIGEFFAVVGCILSVVWMKEWSLEVLGVVQTVVPSFFGGQTMIVMAVYSYIADVSTTEMRTLRIGVVQIVLNIAFPAVQSFSGILFAHIGYIYILLIAAALYMFGLVYGFFVIKEANAPVGMENGMFLMDIFDPCHAIQTILVLFIRKPGNNRLMMCMTLITLFVYSGVVVGETSVFFLYSYTNFHWTQVEYTYFATTNTVVHLVGTLLGVPLFSTLLHLSDIIILILTFLDKIISNLIFGLANSVVLLYTGAVVSIITGITAVAIRSLATKIVCEDDLGKTQSLFGIFEALAPAMFIPLYNKLYISVYDTLPSAFFYVGMILYFVCCVIMGLMICYDKKKMGKYFKKGEDNTTEKPMEFIQITHM